MELLGLYGVVTEVVMSFCVLFFCVSSDCADIVFHYLGTLVLKFSLSALEVMCSSAYTF